MQNAPDRKKKNSRTLDLLSDPPLAPHVTELPQNSTQVRTSTVNISHDIPKKVSAAITLSRMSVRRKSTHPTLSSSIPADILVVKGHETHLLKRPMDIILKKPTVLVSSSPDTKETQVIQASSKTSISSKDTEDIIFEIDKEVLRKSQQLNSKMEVIDTSMLAATRKLASSDKKDSVSSNKIESEPSEYVLIRDVSLQTSLSSDSVDTVTDLFKGSNAGVASLKNIVEKDMRNQEDLAHTTCCGNLCRHTKKGNIQDAYVKSSIDQPSTKPKKSSLAHSSHSIIDASRDDEEDFNTSSRKSVVKIEEPIYTPTPITLSLSQRVLRRLSRKPLTPVGSFITGLTSFNKEDMAIARNVPPKNALSVFEQYSPEEIVHTIKSASDAVYHFHTDTTDAVCQTSGTEMTSVNIRSKNDNQVDELNDKISNNNPTDVNNDVTVMAVSVEYPESTINEKFLKPLNPEGVPLHTRNVPGGDDASYRISLKIPNNNSNYNHRSCSDYRKHEGIVPCRRKHKSIKKKGYEISLSETTTSESISEKTEEVLSDGEVNCKCTASIGEIHVCPFAKKLTSARYLKKHPQNLINHEFGDPNIRIERQREFNSNWIAYYVSRSPSPELDNSESFKSGTDSSGLIRRFK